MSKDTKEIAKAAGGKTSTLDRVRQEKSVAELKDMDFDELIRQAEAAGELTDASQLGEGYHLLRGEDEKEKLVGVPFVVIDWKDNPGRFGDFFTLRIKTKYPVMFGETGYQHFIVNDGSTGIARQMADRKAAGDMSLIYCRHGLQVSKDYEVTTKELDPDTGKTIRKPVIDPSTGKPILGTTFYLDTSL